MKTNNIYIKDRLISFSPLPLRIIVGIAFILHGIPKLSGIDKTSGFFGSIGLSPEFTLPIALLEVIGGIALLLGIATRIASILFIIEMMSVDSLVYPLDHLEMDLIA